MKENKSLKKNKYKRKRNYLTMQVENEIDSVKPIIKYPKGNNRKKKTK